MSELPRNSYRKHWVNEKGEIFCNVLPAGEPLLEAAGLLVPSSEETRGSILRIRRKFKVSRAQLAVALGIGKETLRSWESGIRTPCTAAKRLVQLVEAMFFSDTALALGFGAIMIGKLDLAALERTKRQLLPASARRFLDRFERMQPAAETQQVRTEGEQSAKESL